MPGRPQRRRTRMRLIVSPIVCSQPDSPATETDFVPKYAWFSTAKQLPKLCEKFLTTVRRNIHGAGPDVACSGRMRKRRRKCAGTGHGAVFIPRPAEMRNRTPASARCGDGPPCQRIRYKTAAIESRGRSVLRRAPISMPGPAAGKPSAVLFLRARRKNVENLAYGGRERRRGGWHIRVSARVQAGIPGGWISPDPAAQGHKQWKGERP